MWLVLVLASTTSLPFRVSSRVEADAYFMASGTDVVRWM
jgi:hypothetical protein